MPVNDLRYRVGRSFIEASDIRFRLKGAEYHLGIVREIIENEIIGHPFDSLSGASNDKMHWHTAGFFWELIATFDCALQACTAHHQLSIPRHEITWGKIDRKVSHAGITCPLIEKLGNIKESDWFQDANARRNTIGHWGPVFISSLNAGGQVVAVKAANQMNPAEVWGGYLRDMGELVDIAIRTLPSGHILFHDDE